MWSAAPGDCPAHGRWTSPTTAETRRLVARRAVVLATGTSAVIPPIPGLRDAAPWDNRSATAAKEVPRRFLVLGGGAVGAEMAQAFRRLGADEVTVVEGSERLLGREEPFAGDEVKAAFEAEGIRVVLGVAVTGARREGSDGPVIVTLADGTVVEADEILVAVGRRPSTANLGLETVGLEPGRHVAVDEHLRAIGVAGDWLYAIGDCNGRALLTHMGKYQGRLAADIIAGRDMVDVADGDMIPRVTFTDPQVCAVGLTEAQARERGVAVRTVELPNRRRGRRLHDGQRRQGHFEAHRRRATRCRGRRHVHGSGRPGAAALRHGRHRGRGSAHSLVARGALVPHAERGVAAAARDLRVVAMGGRRTSPHRIAPSREPRSTGGAGSTSVRELVMAPRTGGAHRKWEGSTVPDVSFNSLAVVLAVAFFSRLLLGLFPRLRVPGVVVEIVLGIIVGPSVLGWAHADEPLQILALVGLAFLLFLSGLEIESKELRGQLLRIASVGLVASLVLAVVTGYVLDGVGLISDPLLVAVTLVATSLGLVIPVLKEAGLNATPFGQLVIVGATRGEFSAVLLLSLLFSRDASGTGSKLLLLGVFVALLVVVGLSVARSGRDMKISQVLVRLQDTTAQIRVRGAMLLPDSIRWPVGAPLTRLRVRPAPGSRRTRSGPARPALRRAPG